MLIVKGLQVNIILGQIHRFWLAKRRCQEQNMPATAGHGEKSGGCRGSPQRGAVELGASRNEGEGQSAERQGQRPEGQK